MPINHSKKLLFCHVPKVAGTTIQRAFSLKKDRGEWGHQTAEQLRHTYSDLWGHYTSFAFTRNPYWRLVSAYEFVRAPQSHYFKSASPDEFKGKHPDYDLISSMTFDQAVQAVAQNPDYFSTGDWRPQSAYIGEPGLLKFVGKMESFHDDLNELCRIAEIKPVNITFRLNFTNKDHDDWRRYYDSPATLSLAQSIYAEDFIRFGYSTFLGAAPVRSPAPHK